MLRVWRLSLDDYSRELYDRFVAPDHPLRMLDEAVDFSFVSELVADRYSADNGRPAWHPELMWRLLFAEYYLNLSDAKVCLAAQESMALRWFVRLRETEKPPHRTTLQKFRANRLDEGVYLSIHYRLLAQAVDNGVMDRGERQIFDTTHMRSNTGVVTAAQLLLGARARVVKEVAAVDPAFGAELGQQAGLDRAAYLLDRVRRRAAGLPRLPKEERTGRALAAVTETLGAVRARIANGRLEPTERLNVALALLAKVVADRADGVTRRLVSLHDTEAAKGTKGNLAWDGRKLGVCVQEGSRLVTAAVIASGGTTDDRLLLPALDQQEQRFGLVPPGLAADQALDTSAIRVGLQGRRVEAHIPLRPSPNSWGNGLFRASDFRYDPFARSLTCPAGQTTTRAKDASFQGRSGTNYAFPAAVCRACMLRDRCQRPNNKRPWGRQVHVSGFWALHQGVAEHNQSEAYRVASGRRKRVEAKIWELVHHGARRCRYRGDRRSFYQLLITVVVVNAKRIATLLADRARAGPPLGALAAAA